MFLLDPSICLLVIITFFHGNCIEYRWNARVFAEAARLEQDDQYRARAGRLERWRQVARDTVAEHALHINLPWELKRGNVVLLLAPGPVVALILSFWTGSKKPRLTTKSAGANQITAMRVLELGLLKDGRWAASEASAAFVVQPESIVSILDCEDSTETADFLSLRISDSSETLRANTESAKKWWPGADTDVVMEEQWRFTGRQRHGRRRWIRKAAKKKERLAKPAKVRQRSARMERARQSARMERAKQRSARMERARQRSAWRRKTPRQQLVGKLLSSELRTSARARMVGSWSCRQ